MKVQFVALVLVVAVVSGCKVREAPAPFAVDLRAITPQNISLLNQKLELSVDLLNPGPTERVLAHFVYVLTIAGEPFVSGRVQGIRPLKPGHVYQLRVPATTDLEGLGQLLAAKRRNSAYNLSGYIVRAYTPGKFAFERNGLMSDLDLKPAKGAKPGL